MKHTIVVDFTSLDQLEDALTQHRSEIAGIILEPMDTGAACRTYNVLVAEERRVAAALLPPV